MYMSHLGLATYIVRTDQISKCAADNLDYNLLKHEIKVHTTHDQTTALAIPGHQDPTLRKFEDEFYMELCRQHDRLDLFVTGKADEISRYLGTSQL
jgi:hypothetical protein